MSNVMEVKLSAKSENESLARVIVASFAAKLDPTLDELADIKTAVSEAVTNAIIHGYDEDESKFVYLRCEIKEDTIKIVKEGIAYMKFFAKSLIQELQQYDHVKMEIVGKANLNEWMGKVTPQIFIENYEIKEDKLSDF